jgi:RNA polymerase sigma factor (sigma-70 family)
MVDWLDRVLQSRPECERELVERYTTRLLQLAARQLPERMRGRLDPEDIVQSVFRSFFGRLRRGEFSFEDSQDLWRLLTVMTYHKAQNSIKHHQRGRRDVRRERTVAEQCEAGLAEPAPGPEDLVILYECLEHLLLGLPDEYRAIVTLRLQGETIAEIARKAAYSQRTVLRVLGNVHAAAVKELER